MRPSEITTFQMLLLQAGALELPTLQVGLLVQLYSPNVFGLRVDEARVVSPLKAHREFGHPRRTVPDSLRVLGDAGFIVVDTVTGEKGERMTPTVRLLTDREIFQRLGLDSNQLVENETQRFSDGNER